MPARKIPAREINEKMAAVLARIEAGYDKLTPAEWDERRRKDLNTIKRSKVQFAELAIVYLLGEAQQKSEGSRPSTAPVGAHYEVLQTAKDIANDESLVGSLRSWARDIRHLEAIYIRFREAGRKRAPKIRAQRGMFRNAFEERDPDDEDVH